MAAIPSYTVSAMPTEASFLTETETTLSCQDKKLQKKNLTCGVRVWITFQVVFYNE